MQSRNVWRGCMVDNYNKYLKESGIPIRYINDVELIPETGHDSLEFSKLQKYKSNVKNNVNSGVNLYISSSNAGNGKTTWATSIIKSYLNSVKDFSSDFPPAYFVNVASVLETEKQAIENKELLPTVKKMESNILNSKLVVFDDLGIKNFSPYDISKLYYWIDSRTANNKACIYTSNLSADVLRKTVDKRLADRILNYSNIIEFWGESNRKAKEIL